MEFFAAKAKHFYTANTIKLLKKGSENMPLCENPIHIYEPTPLQCGQAVLAMLSGMSVEEIISICGTERETTLKQMFHTLEYCGIEFSKTRKEIKNIEDLPPVCFLSLETPHCWHWSLYFKGKFLDPEYGVLSEFPPSNRRYYWEIETLDFI